MKCKYCGQEIPAGSVFCMFCGERVARKKRSKQKEIRVPEPRQLPSGAWNIQLRAEGVSVTEATRDACRTKATAIRAGFVKVQKAPEKRTLRSVLRTYMDDNESVLAPDTMRSYESMITSRFQQYMDHDVNEIDWQVMISKEAEKKAPKTVLNGWRFITAALNYSRIPVPSVNLPQMVQKETAWLDYDQILKFLDGIRGRSCELTCILALHSLRISEIRALTQESLKDGVIRVRGAVVPDKTHKLVLKAANKNDTSRRDVPVMIDRLTELWPAEGESIRVQSPSCLRRMIERICKEQGLPIITIHGCRHSFASLAYHLKWDVRTTCVVGGWSDPTCVQRIYTHLAQKDLNENIKSMKAFYKCRFTNEITNENQKTAE